MLRIRLDHLAYLFVLITMLGCLAGGSTKNADDINLKVNTYGKLIRWRAFDDAATYLRTQDNKPISSDTQVYKEIRVTNYKVTRVVLNEEKTQAFVTAEISYYHERVNNVHTIRDMQLWWLDEESGRWYLDGKLPEMKP